MTNSTLAARPQAAQNRQIGSTLLGIIIGLIVGLAIAVVVALVITKGSTPFTNKLGKPASESAPTPIIDPNKPLYGNTQPAKDAAKEFAREAEAAKNAEAALANPAPAAPAAAAPAANNVPPSTTPVGLDPNKKPATTAVPATATAPTAPATTVAKVDPTAPKTDNPDEKWIYYLQAGAFREQGDAENTRARLALLGFEASISERNSDNGVLFRVRLGPFNQVDAMNRARGKLSENGVDVAVIRNQK